MTTTNQQIAETIPTFADISRAVRINNQPPLGIPTIEQAGRHALRRVRLYMVTVTEDEYVDGPVVGLTAQGKPKHAMGSRRTVERFKSKPMAWEALCAFLSGSRVKGNPMHSMSDGGAVDLFFDDRGASQILDDGWHRYTERLTARLPGLSDGEAGFVKKMFGNTLRDARDRCAPCPSFFRS